MYFSKYRYYPKKLNILIIISNFSIIFSDCIFKESCLQSYGEPATPRWTITKNRHYDPYYGRPHGVRTH